MADELDEATPAFADGLIDPAPGSPSGVGVARSSDLPEALERLVRSR